MSSQLKEKQQQKDNKRDFEADKVFNQNLFRTLYYAGAGFGAGLVASVFLKNRKALTLLGTGAGAAYGASNFMNELNQFNRFKDYANQGQQPQTLKREDQLATKNWDNFMPKQQENPSQQKRYGGSDDDDDRKNKSSSQTKTRENKPTEQKGSESTASKPKSQESYHDQLLHKKPTGTKEAPNLNASSKSKESDKSKQQSESQKPSSQKSSQKESDKSRSDQQKSEAQKNLGKEQQRSGKESDRSESGKSESKPDKRGEGQHLQDFKSNTKEAGRPAPGDSEKYRGAERDLHSDRTIDDLRNQQNRVEQDRWGKSKRTGNKMRVEPPTENIAGGQFHGDNLTAHSQVNAVIE